MNHIEARAIDWAAWVRAGDRVVCSHMTAEPVALLRSLASFHDKEDWRTMQHTAMAEDFSWERSALKYAELYRSL